MTLLLLFIRMVLYGFFARFLSVIVLNTIGKHYLFVAPPPNAIKVSQKTVAFRQ